MKLYPFLLGNHWILGLIDLGGQILREEALMNYLYVTAWAKGVAKREATK